MPAFSLLLRRQRLFYADAMIDADAAGLYSHGRALRALVTLLMARLFSPCYDADGGDAGAHSSANIEHDHEYI